MSSKDDILPRVEVLMVRSEKIKLYIKGKRSENIKGADLLKLVDDAKSTLNIICNLTEELAQYEDDQEEDDDEG